MSLQALMQKFGPLGSATATPAIFATEKRNTTGTVARVATVAVAATGGTRSRLPAPRVLTAHGNWQRAAQGRAQLPG
jgi:hypothetical protein